MGRTGGRKQNRREREERRKILKALLRQIRQEAGLRQVEMAERLGKPQSFVSKYETLERRLDLLDLQELCEAAGISLEGFARRFDDACRVHQPHTPS